jgi:ethanolamine ammonia-lyase large subunit
MPTNDVRRKAEKLAEHRLKLKMRKQLAKKRADDVVSVDIAFRSRCNSMARQSSFGVSLALLVLCHSVSSSSSNSTLKISCLTNENCGSSTSECLLNECVCLRGWISLDRSLCAYQLKSKLTAFLLSFFVGFLGIDWFYLSVGNIFYILAGLLKMFTAGGLCIWWIVDWIRILANAFDDGNGVALLDWN